MATAKQERPRTADELHWLQPDPLGAGPEQVERYVAALQLAHQETSAADADRVAWIERQVWDQIRLARVREAGNASEVSETLNRVFRLGEPPRDLDGFKPGFTLGYDGFGPANGAVRALLSHWLPWRGKARNATAGTGTNVIPARYSRLLRLLVPGHRADRTTTGDIACFPFRTYLAPGALDPDLEVLKINYELPENPAAVRMILDELVQVVPDVYLGKVLLRSRRKHRLLMFFAICSPSAWRG